MSGIVKILVAIVKNLVGGFQRFLGPAVGIDAYGREIVAYGKASLACTPVFDAAKRQGLLVIGVGGEI